MALTTAEKALWEIYEDENGLDSAARETFAASDNLARQSMIAWQPVIKAQYIAELGQINARAKEINQKLITVQSTVVTPPTP